MQIVLFGHPLFLKHYSMIRYTEMLATGMRERGYKTEIWLPRSFFVNLPFPKIFKKWLGYIDQYILFPIEVNKRLKLCPSNTLFVLTDHALGPWLHLVANKPHVIHCHDFLAQQSALGQIPKIFPSLTGRIYQSYIRSGYSKGRHFISVSKKTQEDLHKLLPALPETSIVIYNGLTSNFLPEDLTSARQKLTHKIGIDLSAGFLLHVGGNAWYKNREGLIEIIDAWWSIYETSLPLLLVGNHPDKALLARIEKSPFSHNIHFLSDLSDYWVKIAYTGASCLIYPSLAEGFGWPIAEAMACRCPVVTTNEPPMTEVGCKAAFYISSLPNDRNDLNHWAYEGAKVVQQVTSLGESERYAVLKAGFENCKRFDFDTIMNEIECAYQQIMTRYISN